MNSDIFWNIIASYNQQTLIPQLVLILLILISLFLLSSRKWQCLPKISLGIANIFIGIVFFLIFGKEPIQHFFAAPLFIATGLLFLWEGIKYRHDAFRRFNKLQWILFILVLLYPAVSMILGNSFPKIVVYIMPCPLISLSIVVYSGYERKNIFLLISLAIWGLTGVKSFFFNAYEDIILLVCGIYCIWVLLSKIRNKTQVN